MRYTALLCPHTKCNTFCAGALNDHQSTHHARGAKPPRGRSYCKPQHAFYDLAADVMAENPQYVAKHLSQDMQDYLQVCWVWCVCDCPHSGYSRLGYRACWVLWQLKERIGTCKTSWGVCWLKWDCTSR